MSVATVTSKGQLTIPKDVRELLGIESGSKVVFVATQHGVLMKPKQDSVMRLRGKYKYDGPPISEEEYEARFAAGLAEKFRP